MRSCALCCIGVVTVVGLVIGGSMYLFGEQLLSIYSPGNAEVIQLGMVRIRVIATTYFLCGIMEVGSGVLRGLGKSLTSMLVAIAGSCLFRVIWIYSVFAVFRSLDVLYISYPVSWVLTATAHYFFAILAVRKVMKQQRLESVDSVDAL